MGIYLCLDPGHGQGNRKPGKDDPGAVSFGVKEKDIAYDFALSIKHVAVQRGHRVLLTRNNSSEGKDVPVGARARIARANKCDAMISLHCNSSLNWLVSGLETFYRTSEQKDFATIIHKAVYSAIGGKDRGVKHESQSQHKSLAVLDFRKCCLVELGFLTHLASRKMLQNRDLRVLVAESVVDALEKHFA